MSNIKMPVMTADAAAIVAMTAEADKLHPTQKVEADATVSTEVSIPSSAKSYQFMSSPCAFVLSSGRQILSHESVYTTDIEEEIKELDAAVRVGNVFAVY